MAWADAGQRLEAMPTARTGRDFAVSNRPAVSTPATAACWCRYQGLTASGMIYDHVSFNYHYFAFARQQPHVAVARPGSSSRPYIQGTVDCIPHWRTGCLGHVCPAGRPLAQLELPVQHWPPSCIATRRLAAGGSSGGTGSPLAERREGAPEGPQPRTHLTALRLGP